MRSLFLELFNLSSIPVYFVHLFANFSGGGPQSLTLLPVQANSVLNLRSSVSGFPVTTEGPEDRALRRRGRIHSWVQLHVHLILII